MVTIKNAIEIIKKLVADLQAQGYNPLRVVLFGSVAKGTAHKYSDIDVAIWDDRFIGCAPFDYEPILPLLRNYRGVELHTYQGNEDVNSNPFIAEIEKDCIEIEFNQLISK